MSLTVSVSRDTQNGAVRWLSNGLSCKLRGAISDLNLARSSPSRLSTATLPNITEGVTHACSAYFAIAASRRKEDIDAAGALMRRCRDVRVRFALVRGHVNQPC